MRTRNIKLSLESLEDRRLLAAVSIPDDLSGKVAAIVSAPVNIDTAAGVRAAEIRLQYDTALLDLANDSVVVGSVWDGNNDTQVTANVDDSTGTVIIFVSSSTALSGVSGSLVRLNFTISSTATVGAIAELDLTSVILNEGAVPVTPAPIVGADSTDGQILVVQDTDPVGNDRISGVVFADANQDGIVSLGEAIPGVLITLTHVATGTQRQATTSLDGSYEFLNLAAGAYLIQQQQPLAFLEGGPNSINAQLVEGTALENQNFREGSLRPQFLYTRLLTTTVEPVGSTVWQSQIAQINTDAMNGTTAAPSRATFVASTAPVNSNVAATQNASAALRPTSLAPEGEAGDMVMLVTSEQTLATPPLEKEDEEADPLARNAAIDQAMLEA